MSFITNNNTEQLISDNLELESTRNDTSFETFVRKRANTLPNFRPETPVADKLHYEAAKRQVLQTQNMSAGSLTLTENLVTRAEEVCENMEKQMILWQQNLQIVNIQDQQTGVLLKWNLVALAMIIIFLFTSNNNYKLDDIEEQGLRIAGAVSSMGEYAKNIKEGRCVLEAKLDIVKGLDSENLKELKKLKEKDEEDDLKKLSRFHEHQEKKKAEKENRPWYRKVWYKFFALFGF